MSDQQTDAGKTDADHKAAAEAEANHRWRWSQYWAQNVGGGWHDDQWRWMQRFGRPRNWRW